jgi:hypothetical protein
MVVKSIVFFLTTYIGLEPARFSLCNFFWSVLGHNFFNRALQSPKDIGQPNLADFVHVLYEVFSSL